MRKVSLQNNVPSHLAGVPGGGGGNDLFILNLLVSRQAAERGVCHRRLQRQDEQHVAEGLQEGLLLRNLSAGQAGLSGGLTAAALLAC